MTNIMAAVRFQVRWICMTFLRFLPTRTRGAMLTALSLGWPVGQKSSCNCLSSWVMGEMLKGKKVCWSWFLFLCTVLGLAVYSKFSHGNRSKGMVYRFQKSVDCPVVFPRPSYHLIYQLRMPAKSASMVQDVVSPFAVRTIFTRTGRSYKSSQPLPCCCWPLGPDSSTNLPDFWPLEAARMRRGMGRWRWVDKVHQRTRWCDGIGMRQVLVMV